MELAALLFARSPLRVIGMRITPNGVTLVAEPARDFAFCPACGVRSARVHGRHRRTLQDLPAHGRVVHIELHLKPSRIRLSCGSRLAPERRRRDLRWLIPRRSAPKHVVM